MNKMQIEICLEQEFRIKLARVIGVEEHFKDHPAILAFYIKVRDMLLLNKNSNELYTLFENIAYTGEKLDFLLSIESFLANACLDDSSFIIDWTTYWVNPNDKFDYDTKRRVVTEPFVGNPCVRWGTDDDDYIQDVSLLDEALEYLIEKSRKLRIKIAKFDKELGL
jgi:hypothetical protein